MNQWMERNKKVSDDVMKEKTESFIVDADHDKVQRRTDISLVRIHVSQSGKQLIKLAHTRTALNKRRKVSMTPPRYIAVVILSSLNISFKWPPGSSCGLSL